MFFVSFDFKFDCLNKPTKKPREKREGIVLSPNISITNAPQNALPVLAAVIAKT